MLLEPDTFVLGEFMLEGDTLHDDVLFLIFWLTTSVGVSAENGHADLYGVFLHQGTFLNYGFTYTHVTYHAGSLWVSV